MRGLRIMMVLALGVSVVAAPPVDPSPSAAFARVTEVVDEGGDVGAVSSGAGPAFGTYSWPVDGPAFGTYSWPVDGPVLRPFEPPEGPFGAGHRGIDIGAVVGTPVTAPADGVVAFAGKVAGALFVSVDHADGVRTTYSWLSSVDVRTGDAVIRGQLLARTGLGHPGVDPSHLHFGARYAGAYLDPMLLLERGGVEGLIRLARLEEVTPPPS
jgi:murein DD-endopeptidase MepM/ murein hydrolase activator NlpD